MFLPPAGATNAMMPCVTHHANPYAAAHAMIRQRHALSRQQPQDPDARRAE